MPRSMHSVLAYFRVLCTVGAVMSEYTKDMTRRERKERYERRNEVDRWRDNGAFVDKPEPKPYKRPAQDVKDYVRRLNRGWM